MIVAYRIETDNLGKLEIPADALYGINAARAKENFPDTTPFPSEWYRAMGTVKLACYKTYRRFRDAASEKYGKHPAVRIIPDDILDAITDSASEVADGKYFEHFIVPAVQGGAGTSINMNINEIISNAGLLKLGYKCGTYDHIDPFADANIFQSTNDVVPTALTVAVMWLLNDLEESINALRKKIETFEQGSREKLRPGYTQMQEAVPSSFGLLFSAYNDALSRDWWRVSKCSERVRQVNLGGGATGTGTAIPRFFIMEVVPELRSLTGLPLSQSENLTDATSNLDRWVEIHATLKAHAVNMEKMASDLRLLASDISGDKSISIPGKQVGSSIMPGKVNPVIPEFIISASHKVYAADNLISSLSGQGCLELNAYLPVIGCSITESLKLLIAACRTAAVNLIDGLEISDSTGYYSLLHSPAIATALIPFTGYHNAALAARLMKEKNLDILEANAELKMMDEAKLRMILQPGNLLKLGFSLEETTDK